MNQIYLRSFFFILGFFLLNILPGAAQIGYVNSAATGANDGTSWDNAYTDLDDALADTTVTSVWIATGVYTPGDETPDTLSRFTVSRSISIVGGFAGTESSLDERDIQANPTILSGDIAGDDVMDDFDNNKEDNVLHVVFVDSLLEAPVVFDGLTISGGHNNPFLDGFDEYFWRGAGVFAYSSAEFYNCTFTQNFANSGAGAYVRPFGPNPTIAVFENCTVTRNFASGQAALYFNSLAELNVDSCAFTDNIADRGGLYPAFCQDVNITNCTFDNNFNETGFGGAFFTWQCPDISIDGCAFTNNVAFSSAAGYIDGRDVTSLDPESVVIQNSTFEGNVATGSFGGALNIWRMPYRVSNCQFIGNSADASGGAISNGGDDKFYIIENSSFQNNNAGFGGAMNNYGARTNATIRACEFIQNEAATSGGAIINGFEAVVTIDSCLFEENTGSFAAAIFNQNDTTSATISNSTFVANSSVNSGGAISKIRGPVLDLDNCTFIGNASDFGAALSISDVLNPDSPEAEGSFTARNSIFDFNIAETQAGAINLNNAPTLIESCVIVNNTAVDGAGGGISANGSDSTFSELTIVNTTFANNFSAIGANLAGFTSDVAELTINIQNNIFFSEIGGSYATEDGAPVVVSRGGNLVNDDTMDPFLNGDKDVSGFGQDPLFLDAANSDYRPSLDPISPAINGGVADGAPEFDIEGKPRIFDPDKGAYEQDATTDLEEVTPVNLGQLRVAPNPAGAETQLRLQNAWRGRLQVSLYDIEGRLVNTFAIDKGADFLEAPLDLSQLNTGVYRLVVAKGDQVLTLPVVRK